MKKEVGVPLWPSGLDLTLSLLWPQICSIPGQGTKIPQAIWGAPPKKKMEKEKYQSKMKY